MAATVYGVSAESNAQFIAFRRLVYSLSQQLTQQEIQALVYIRLYKYKEKYKDATALDVLVKLEADGVFSPSNAEGLMEIVSKDLRRQDLAAEVKEFIKKRSKKAGSTSGHGKHSKPRIEWNSEEDLHLKATFEVTLAQATVLMQQVEILERALAGGKEQRKRAENAIREAGQTAATLAERLRRAQKEMGMADDSTTDPDSDSPVDSRHHYINARTLPQPLSRSRTDVPPVTSRHSLPAFLLSQPNRSQVRSNNVAGDHQQLVHPQQCTGQETLNEEDDEDDYEKMDPAGVVATPYSQSYTGQRSSLSSAYNSSSTITYNPQDGTIIGRKASSGTRHEQANAANTTDDTQDILAPITYRKRAQQFERNTQKSSFTESSAKQTSTGNQANGDGILRGSLQKQPSGMLSERDTLTQSLVQPSKIRTRPVVPPRRRITVSSNPQTSLGSTEEASQNDTDDGYTTLHPVHDTMEGTSDSGFEDLQHLRKFISTDPVLNDAASAHYYKHLQRTEEDLEDDPYASLNYGET